MRRLPLFTGTAVLLVSLNIAQPAETQNALLTQPQVTQNQDIKIKVKDDRVIVRDKSKPVRTALEDQYKKVAQAQINEDIEAMRALRTPDFSVDLPNGDRWDLETSLNYSRSGFQQVESNISISNTIESLDVHGNPLPACGEGEGGGVASETTSPLTPLRLRRGECAVAVAVVHQRWSRMQFKGGQLRRVDTEAIQTETWVNTKDGWKLKHIGNVQPGAWYVDGKRIDPSKPYDPDAPEFRPR